MKIRTDTFLASFVVSISSSFLTALAMLLIKSISLPMLRLDERVFAEVTVNIIILFILSIFVLFKGSTLAAWLLYRHDVAWGYKLSFKRVVPIFILSLIMAIVIFSAIYMYSTGELEKFVYIAKAVEFLE